MMNDRVKIAVVLALLLTNTILGSKPIVLDKYSHDIQMAVFKFSTEKEALTIEAKLVREDFELALLKLNPQLDLNKEQEVTETAKQYLTNHTRIKLDKKPTNFLIETAERDAHYFLISGRLLSSNPTWSSLEFWNTCLVNEIDGHSNIIHFEIDDQTRSFRMSKKRFQINIER